MKNLHFCSVLATALAREMARCSRVLRSLFLVAAVVPAVATSHISTANPQSGTKALTFAERVAYQRAIEEVYWRHRIWPKERSDSKPGLNAVMSQAQLEEKVEAYLRKSQALEDYQRQALTAEQLQAEMDRMAQHTKQPEVLRELFEALGNDPFAIAECLARPALAERFHADLSAQNNTGHCESMPIAWLWSMSMPGTFTEETYILPKISDRCTDDTWTAINVINAPDARAGATAVWTGAEMIVWGGYNNNTVNTGGRYDPATDTWTATSLTNAPSDRYFHTAVWTGSEMIIWGGYIEPISLNTGGRYNPIMDSWVATSTINAPDARSAHTAVWTGSEMIVWGGPYLNTGGRYDPSTDSWTATSTTDAPTGRLLHTAVWTGSEMIVWGGICGHFCALNTGRKYNPATDSWTATSTSNAPGARGRHTAVWTGNEMIIWGGDLVHPLPNTGGRYNPSTDSWRATSTISAPEGRWNHTAVWTGSEMIVWGGWESVNSFNSGGRYDPGTDSWTATGPDNAPERRYHHTAAWTGNAMIVWGGVDQGTFFFNTGGSYCAQSGATPTPRPSPTPRSRPTPRPRP